MNSVSKWYYSSACLLAISVVIFAASCKKDAGSSGVNQPESAAAVKKPQLNQQGLAFAESFYGFFLRDALTGGKAPVVSAPDAMNILGISESIDATTYSKRYHDNELAADNYYKNKRLLVNGGVYNVSKDAVGDAYVSMRGTNGVFDTVKAVIASDSLQSAAELKKGSKVYLVCDPAGMGIMSATLANCSTFRDYVNSQQRNLDRHIASFLSGNEPLPINNDDRYKITIAYILGSESPPDPACSQVREQCLFALNRIVESLNLNSDSPQVVKAHEMAESLKGSTN